MFCLESLLDDLAVSLKDHRIGEVMHDASAVIRVGLQYAPRGECLLVQMFFPGLLDALLEGEELLADCHELVYVYFLLEDSAPELLEATDRITHQFFYIATQVLN